MKFAKYILLCHCPTDTLTDCEAKGTGAGPSAGMAGKILGLQGMVEDQMSLASVLLSFG